MVITCKCVFTTVGSIFICLKCGSTHRWKMLLKHIVERCVRKVQFGDSGSSWRALLTHISHAWCNIDTALRQHSHVHTSRCEKLLGRLEPVASFFVQVLLFRLRVRSCCTLRYLGSSRCRSRIQHILAISQLAATVLIVYNRVGRIVDHLVLSCILWMSAWGEKWEHVGRLNSTTSIIVVIFRARWHVVVRLALLLGGCRGHCSRCYNADATIRVLAELIKLARLSQPIFYSTIVASIWGLLYLCGVFHIMIKNGCIILLHHHHRLQFRRCVFVAFLICLISTIWCV